MSDIQELLDGAGDIAGELEQLRGHFEALDLEDGRQWVGRELEAYPAGSVVLRYRRVPRRRT